MDISNLNKMIIKYITYPSPLPFPILEKKYHKYGQAELSIIGKH